MAGAVLLSQGQRRPGCTTEGIDFNALLPKFRKLGATVLGVSRDSVKSHENFCAKQGFRFDLVSDADETLCNAFGVIKRKEAVRPQGASASSAAPS